MARQIYGARSRRAPSSRAVVSAISISGLMATALVVNAGAASAAVPVFPDNIVVFPDRDFVSVEGYSDPAYAGKEALIEVTRGDTVIGSARAVISGTDVAFEVNHPGGVCWGAGTSHQVTPDIKPGDVVSLTLPDGLEDDTRVGDAYVTEDMVLEGNVLTVKGFAGAGVNTGQMEQRVINPDLKDTDVGRRDIRAVPGEAVSAPGYSSTLVFAPAPDSPGASTFLATYVFDDAATAQVAAAADLGERAMSWELEDPDANRQGLTIAEFGEAGGPGMGGCPAGPGDQGAPTPGAAQVVRSQDGTSIAVGWTPANAEAGAEPVSGYSIVALAGTPLPNGHQVQVGRRTGPDATSTTIGGLTPEETYAVEVRSMAGGRMSEAFTTTAGPVQPGDETPPTLVLVPAPVADGVVETASVTAGSDDGEIFYSTGAAPAISGGLPSDAALPYTGPIAITEQTTLHFAAFDSAGNYTVLDGTYRPPAGTDEPPAAPTGLTAVAGQGSVNLRWSTVTAATSYQVTVYPSGEQHGVPLEPTTATTQTVADLVPGTTYDFTVRALAGTVVGAESPRVSATPLPVTDVVTVTTARWKLNDFRVDGTGSLPGEVIRLYTVTAQGEVGVPIANAETTVVAAVAPEVGGTWSVRLRNAAAPTTSPGRVFAKSSAGGVAGPVDVVSK